MAEFNECQSRFLSLNLFTTSRNSKSSLNIRANAASCNRKVNPLKPHRAYSYLSFNQGNAKTKKLNPHLEQTIGSLETFALNYLRSHQPLAAMQ